MNRPTLATVPHPCTHPASTHPTTVHTPPPPTPPHRLLPLFSAFSPNTVSPITVPRASHAPSGASAVPRLPTTCCNDSPACPRHAATIAPLAHDMLHCWRRRTIARPTLPLRSPRPTLPLRSPRRPVHPIPASGTASAHPFRASTCLSTCRAKQAAPSCRRWARSSRCGCPRRSTTRPAPRSSTRRHHDQAASSAHAAVPKASEKAPWRPTPCAADDNDKALSLPSSTHS
eukprot:364610-Chlamydomonas_euryale.AAC.5